MSRIHRMLKVGIFQRTIPHYRVPVFRRLAEKTGWEIHLWAAPHAPNSYLNTKAGSAGFELHPSLIKRIGPFFIHGAMLRVALTTSCDVLIFPWNSRFLTLLSSIMIARLRGIRTILWGHGYSKRDTYIRRAIRLMLVLPAHACLLYDHETAKTIAATNIPRKKIYVAPNALDQEPIQKARRNWLDNPRRLEVFRNQEQINGRRIILFVSRLLPENRLDWLIAAFQRIKIDQPEALLVIVGDGPCKQKLSKLTQNDYNHIRLLGSCYQEESLAPWFLSAHCLAYPAQIGLSLLHAFGYGVPVVTSDALAQQNPEICALRPRFNGLLYQHGDIVDLSAKLQQAINNDVWRAQASKNALRTVLAPQGFNLERMVDGFIAAISESIQPLH